MDRSGNVKAKGDRWKNHLINFLCKLILQKLNSDTDTKKLKIVFKKATRKVRGIKKSKGIEALKVKHPTSSQAVDAIIGDEEQNGKEKKTKRKKQGMGSHPSCRGPYSRLLRRAGIIR